MRISGAAIGGGELTGSRKASIERQIKKLEEKRDEILEKLGAKKSKKSSQAQEPAGVSGGTLHVGATGSAGQGGVAAPQSGEGAAAQPDTSSGNAQNIGQILHAASQKLSSASSAIPSDASEDPKELMKQLQLIEVQIMALRQQLDEGSSEAIELDPDEAAALATAGMEAREAVRSTGSDAARPDAALPALPTVESTPGGHIDGYA